MDNKFNLFTYKYDSANLINGFILNFIYLQTEIAKRLNALISQVLPCLQGEHQQQVLQAVERAKTVTMQELNAIIGVSF